MMIRTCTLLFLLAACCIPEVKAQNHAGTITCLEIRDNRNSLLTEYHYRLTLDSLIIRGRTEREHPVNYLARPWTRKEKKQIRDLMNTAQPGQFGDSYAGGFNNMAFISAENYPRILAFSFTTEGRVKEVKVTNTYVAGIARLIENVNALLPSETRIRYVANDFEKTPEPQAK